MMHVMKRHKADARGAKPQLQQQQQQSFPSGRYCSLYSGADTPSNKHQHRLQDSRHYGPTGGDMPRSGGFSRHPVYRVESAISELQSEQLDTVNCQTPPQIQQFPTSITMTPSVAARNSSLFLTPSPVSTSWSSARSTTPVSFADTRPVCTQRSLSLPGISTMLRIPTPEGLHSIRIAGAAITPGVARDSKNGTSLARSPMVLRTNSLHRLSPYKRTLDISSINPSKMTGAASYHDHSLAAIINRRGSICSVATAPSDLRSSEAVGAAQGRQSFDSLDGKWTSASSSSSKSNSRWSQIGIRDTTASEQRIANPNKNSRYLREMDRREILARIEQGEKQATLAKEYQVSRAAICNLNKHREDVMLRKDENPLAKHPKKPRPKSLKVKTSSSSVKAANRKLSAPRFNGTGVSGKGNNVHEVKSRAAMLLLASLRNKNTPMSEFRRSSERLMLLVLEDALALVPIKVVELFFGDSVRADGVSWEHPPCAISMECHVMMKNAGSPLLDLFRAIEPDQPTARVSVVDHSGTQRVEVSETTASSQQVVLVDSRMLPASLKYHNIFVFAVTATSSDTICAVVEKLQERGAVEAMIYLVVLVINAEVIARVHKKHPSAKFVAAQIDTSEKLLLPTSAPPPDNADVGIRTAASGETFPSQTAQPLGSLELMLRRFRQVYINISPPPTVEDATS